MYGRTVLFPKNKISCSYFAWMYSAVPKKHITKFQLLKIINLDEERNVHYQHRGVVQYIPTENKTIFQDKGRVRKILNKGMKMTSGQILKKKNNNFSFFFKQ